MVSNIGVHCPTACSVRLLCSSAQLYELLERVLELRSVVVQLGSLGEASAFAAWLSAGSAAGRGCARLALQLRPPSASLIAGQQGSAGFRPPQTTSWAAAWEGLAGATSLEALSWDALPTTAPASPSGSPMAQRTQQGPGVWSGAGEGPLLMFDHPPLPLPRLSVLSVRAPALGLTPAYSAATAITELSLGGTTVSLAPGCLPASLIKLTVDWQRGVAQPYQASNGHHGLS